MSLTKIIAFPMPAMGHMNPLFAVVKELVQTCNVKMIIYSNESFKKRIEENGCEYRYLGDFSADQVQENIDKKANPGEAFSSMITNIVNLIDNNIMRITKEIEEEKPNIIIHDNIATFAKWIVKLVRNRFENKNKNTNGDKSSLEYMPTIISYHTTFAFLKGVYPSEQEMKMVMSIGFFDKLQLMFRSIGIMSKLKELSRKYGIEGLNPMDDFLTSDVSIPNVVFVLPQLQPCEHLMHKNIHFAGACIADDMSLNNLDRITDDSMKSFLQMFAPKNPTRDLPKENEKILVYVSLGSLFRADIDFYNKFIDAFKTFDQDPKAKDSKIKGENLYGIITVGSICYEKYKEGQFDVPKNLKLVPYAPQLEILKRASLFVTHCGMNSTSESVHFGVPMICMPFGADQPLVAQRVTKELGLGVQFNLNNTVATELRSSFHEVLSDKRLKQRLFDYSLLSREHNGVKATCEFLKNYF